jgi:hypothetical protein
MQRAYNLRFHCPYGTKERFHVSSPFPPQISHILLYIQDYGARLLECSKICFLALSEHNQCRKKEMIESKRVDARTSEISICIRSRQHVDASKRP